MAWLFFVYSIGLFKNTLKMQFYMNWIDVFYFWIEIHLDSFWEKFQFQHDTNVIIYIDIDLFVF